ncbi:hypothetical protein [Paradesulfitobacterium ferrireducens]|uniref:hypothetical protein n=1 Tax=Paradesulfitobacterium ferrireducens TaxID=2816476 RepID=UPI001A8FE318|nr:hypothetical protein [Paradesulfitobacterium ferrireducens]
MREILLKVEYGRDLDIVVYTPREWEKYHHDSTGVTGSTHFPSVRLNQSVSPLTFVVYVLYFG